MTRTPEHTLGLRVTGAASAQSAGAIAHTSLPGIGRRRRSVGVLPSRPVLTQIGHGRS